MKSINALHNPNRRDFLKTAGATTLAALAGGAPQLSAESRSAPPLPATADTFILLWMAGGMAHTETFDPKHHTPFRKGMQAEEVISTFPAIDTAVGGIQLSAGLDNVAAVMDRGTLIRGHVLGDLGKILHSRHQFHWHTGYEPPLTVAAPHIGAWMARILGPLNPAVPAFIDIGQPYAGNGEAEELKAFQTAGFLGSEYGPFRIPYPSRAIQSVRPPGNMKSSRFQNRYRAFSRLAKAGPTGRYGSDYHYQSLLRSLENAHRLMNSSAAKSLDLTQEPKAIRNQYGESEFGKGCLLARRLTEGDLSVGMKWSKNPQNSRF